MRAIVTTTINPPTEALKKYANKRDWQLIVVGDIKTPHEKYKDYYYLNPSVQETKYKKLSDKLGWNCIQRRNIGIVEAYRLGAEIIALVDDDNIPYDTWGDNLSIGREILADYYEVGSEVFDPLSVTNNNHLWHRGYPIELLPTKNNITYKGERKITPLIQADLWDGDPDIDAICRITYRPMVKFDTVRPFFANKPGPFNSQNTFLSRKVVKDYFLFAGIGRMDDIWASYRLKNVPMVYAPASVYQERNEHNLTRDLADEMLGYRYSLEYFRGNHSFTDQKQYETYREYFKK